MVDFRAQPGRGGVLYSFIELTATDGLVTLRETGAASVRVMGAGCGTGTGGWIDFSEVSAGYIKSNGSVMKSDILSEYTVFYKDR